MPTCSYCGEELEGEADHLDHLRDVHADELGPIDRRRVSRDDSGVPVGRNGLLLTGLIVVVGGVFGYIVISAGGGGGGAGPTAVGSVHYHGTIEMTVAGEPVDFGDPKYVHPRDHPAFHFDVPDDPQWHVHAQGVTLGYALGTLGIDLERNSLTFDGVTYVEGDSGTDITVEVGGESVGPDYVLQPGDHVRIVVTVGG